MLTTLATLAALALAQQTDTTVPVRAGARLEINNFGGEIAVKTWSRNAVRVVADHSSRDRKSTRLNSSHGYISYAVFCLKKKNTISVEKISLFISPGKVARVNPVVTPVFISCIF